MSSEKAFKLAFILTAIDKATRVINSVTDKTKKQMKEMQRASRDAFEKGLGQAATAYAISKPLIEATQAAVGFEDKMADVAKVMNLTVGGADFKAMSNEAKDLALHMGKTSEEAAGMMASLAAGGVDKSEIAKVGKYVGEWSVAFSMGGEAAGDAFVKIKNALSETTEGTKKIGDQINWLSDTMASQANEIVTFMASGGSSVASAYKQAGGEAAAFGSTLISIGKSASESATIYERMAKGIMKDDKLRGIFNKAGGGSDGFVAVLEAGAKASDKFTFFKKFGEYGSDIQLLSAKTDMLKTALKGVNDQTNIGNSVAKEFANRNSTTAGKLNNLKASFDVLKVNLGEAFLPLIKRVAEGLIRVTNAVSKWAKENPGLTKTIGVLVGMVAGIMTLNAAFNITKAGFIAMRVAMIANVQSLVTGFKAIRTAFIMLRTAIMTNPIGLLLTAIAVIATLIIMNWSKIGPFFQRLWDRVKSFFSSATQFIKSNIMTFLWPPSLIFKHWDKLKNFFSHLWEAVKKKFWEFVQWFIDLHKKFYEAGRNIVMSIGKGISDYAQELLNKVKKLAKDIRDFFPFSPAKRGPLTDIHRIKLVETIAGNIKSGPMIQAMTRLARDTRNSIGGTLPVMAGAGVGGGGITINYSPQIMGPGGGPGGFQTFQQQLKEHGNEIVRIVKAEIEKQKRTKF